MRILSLLLLVSMIAMAGCHINTYIDKSVVIHIPDNKGKVEANTEAINSSETALENLMDGIGAPELKLLP